MERSLVSIIIPTYNSAEYIAETIDSALKQTYEPKEVIVVDDGSTDNTRDIIKSYVRRVKYIRKENGGPASARNLGIKESNGEFIALLDSDDIWLPEKLEFQIKLIEDDDRIGLVGCNSCWISKDGVILDNIRKGEYRNYTERRDFLRRLMFSNVVSSGSNACLRRECFEKVGLFDEDVNLKGVEDWDMWLRVFQYYDIKFVEKILLKKREREGSVCSPGNIDRMLKNELYMVRKEFRENILFPRNALLKGRILSYRYLCAGWTYNNLGERSKAVACLLHPICMFPLVITQRFFWSLLYRVLIGNGLLDN